MLQKYRDIYVGMKVQEVFVNHEELANRISPQAKAVVRCGAFQPYGSIAIYPAINAAEWYEAEGTIVPDIYKGTSKNELLNYFNPHQGLYGTDIIILTIVFALCGAFFTPFSSFFTHFP
jgi:hypothetical protein